MRAVQDVRDVRDVRDVPRATCLFGMHLSHLSTSARGHLITSALEHVSTSARRHVSTSARRHVGTSARRHVSTCLYISVFGALITCRTSIGMPIGLPSGPGADEARPAIS